MNCKLRHSFIYLAAFCLGLMTVTAAFSQETLKIPKVYSNIFLDEQGKPYFKNPETQEIFTIMEKPGNKQAEAPQASKPGKPKAIPFPDTVQPGLRKTFWFAYASDSRNGLQKGDTNKNGVNVFALGKIMAMAAQFHAVFFQFTGDMGSGYTYGKEDAASQIATWKESSFPYGHMLPLYTGMGNHECIMTEFKGKADATVKVDRFPFAQESTEANFAECFGNPDNGPLSEDGSAWDPDPLNQDFPSYKGNVFYYTYDNIAMVVLNSDYWYAPTAGMIKYSGGNPHGYIMDMQLEWLKKTLQKLEDDRNIDHVFVTLHTPIFPNGGHSDNCMWYGGKNDARPYIAGKTVDKGIIERRDELLDLMINKSHKVLAILCGDEHNYSRLKITDSMPRYPENWDKPKLSLRRDLYQITNGCAGAPFYKQEKLPWSNNVEKFTAEFAVCLFYVHGDEVRLETLNPVKLGVIEEFFLRRE